MQKYIKYTPLLLLTLLPIAVHAEDTANFTSNSSSNSAAAAGVAGVIGVVFIFFALFYIALFVFSILGFILWIFMLIDVVQRTNWEHENDRTTWILIVVLLGIIGAIIYYFMVRKKLGPAHAHGVITNQPPSKTTKQ